MTATDAEVLAGLDFQVECKTPVCLYGRGPATSVLTVVNPCGCRVATVTCRGCTEAITRSLSRLAVARQCARCARIWVGKLDVEWAAL